MNSDINHRVTIEKILTELLHANGVVHLVVSPGSRNASLISEAEQSGYFNMHFVVDERSAAFAALGISLIEDAPVAIVCTSGTAMLNYSPAIAEAYYRSIPLIAITTDRPKQWIGQDDSQTINQVGIYANITRSSIDLPVLSDEESVWYSNRILNNLFFDLRKWHGPVHINVQIAQPTVAVECSNNVWNRAITFFRSRQDAAVHQVRELAATIASPRKVIIVAGFMPPSSKLNRALSKLAQKSNVVVISETISNLHSPEFLGAADLMLKTIGSNYGTQYLPDVAISLGGSLVSRRLKDFLRSTPGLEHWYVGKSTELVDCFKKLTKVIDMEPAIFLEQLAPAMAPFGAESDWSSLWERLNNKSLSTLQYIVDKAPWSDLAAFNRIIHSIPRRWNVQFSNGTPIRYAQLFPHNYHRCDCNRGVSGIDGCISTAIGASAVYNDVTLLVCGDTSASYDISALGLDLVSPKFKMIVIRNGGGGIFRFIGATRNLSIREKYLCGQFELPLKEMAQAYNFRYFSSTNMNELIGVLKLFVHETTQPCVLEIFTPAEESASLLDQILN